MFVGIFSVLVFVGALVALIPNVPMIALLVGIQTLNGMLLPVILVFILLLINDRQLVVGHAAQRARLQHSGLGQRGAGGRRRGRAGRQSDPERVRHRLLQLIERPHPCARRLRMERPESTRLNSCSASIQLAPASRHSQSLSIVLPLMAACSSAPAAGRCSGTDDSSGGGSHGCSGGRGHHGSGRGAGAAPCSRRCRGVWGTSQAVVRGMRASGVCAMYGRGISLTGEACGMPPRMIEACRRRRYRCTSVDVGVRPDVPVGRDLARERYAGPI